jgi:nucleoside-diphosphate-sugar epimerase
VKNLIESDYIYFGYGKITNYLIERACSQGKSVTCVTNQKFEIFSNRNLAIIDYASIREFHVESRTAIFSWNGKNASNAALLEWMSSNSFSLKNSFFLSSASVYKDSDVSLNEDASNLEDDYVRNKKYLLEQVLLEVLGKKGINHTNLRVSNVFGETLDYGFIANLIYSIEKKISAAIFDQENITRDYLSIEDLSIAIDKLSIVDIAEENLNVGTGKGISISRVLEVFEKLGYRFQDADYVNAPLNIKKSVVLDCTRLKNIVDWQPVDFDQDIKRILQTFREPI